MVKKGTAPPRKNPPPPRPVNKKALCVSVLRVAVVISIIIATWGGLSHVLLNLPEATVCRIQGYPHVSLPTTTATPPSASAGYNSTMLWGTYRPHLYFGMRTREPSSVLVGTAYSDPRMVHMRHHAADGVVFKWTSHDGMEFGEQVIEDVQNSATVHTDFVKTISGDQGGDWVARVTGKRGAESRGRPLLLLPHVILEEGAFARVEQLSETTFAVEGKTALAGSFTFVVVFDSPGGRLVARHKKSNPWDIDFRHLRDVATVTSPNQVAVAHECTGNFRYHMLLLSHSTSPSHVLPDSSGEYDNWVKHVVSPHVGCSHEMLLRGHEKRFDERFRRAFQLDGVESSEGEVGMARTVVSSLLGGMGYWYGEGKQTVVRVDEKGKKSKHIEPIPAQELFSCTPSRSKFPRGFLWDEGFHQLVVARWQAEVSKDVIVSWLSQMTPDGWIAREQIRGSEPRTRVPEQFVPQSSDFANPPTLLLQIQNFASDPESHGPFLKHVWPYLLKWADWFDRTQVGYLPDTYRWRGKKGHLLLTCGLDDYPRAKCNAKYERHVDLQSWMALMYDTMADIASAIGEEAAGLKDKAKRVRTSLRDHWDPASELFSDITNCTGTPSFLPYMGYVNLFPVMTGALDINNPEDRQRILLTVEGIRRELLTPYGVQSLSNHSLRHVAKHENYWTGPIWININYMLLRAFQRYHYSTLPEVAALRDDLRQNLVDTIYSEFVRTGTVWESYEKASGRGKGTAPFTGWTTLVALILGGIY